MRIIIFPIRNFIISIITIIPIRFYRKSYQVIILSFLNMSLCPYVEKNCLSVERRNFPAIIWSIQNNSVPLHPCFFRDTLAIGPVATSAWKHFINNYKFKSLC